MVGWDFYYLVGVRLVFFFGGGGGGEREGVLGLRIVFCLSV